MGFKLKQRTVEVQMDGDFAGMTVTGKKSLPWRTMRAIAEFAEEQDAQRDGDGEQRGGGKALFRMQTWLTDWLVGWNLVDDAGNEILLTDEAVADLPSDLVMALFTKMNETLTGGSELPLASESESEATTSAP